MPLIVFGRSVLADSVVELGQFAGFAVTRLEGDEELSVRLKRSYCVIATQGAGDKAALKSALHSPCDTVLFVASQKKTASLKAKLASTIDQDRMNNLIAPAGLNISAVGPAEIAISIIAQLISLRRQPGAKA